MQVEVLVKNSTNRTIWDAKSGHLFAYRAPGRLQNGPSDSLDVLWCSRGLWLSSSFFRHTSHFPEVLNPQQNGFPVWYSVLRGDLVVSTECTLHCYDRVTLQKVGINGKCALLVGPHHLTTAECCNGNFPTTCTFRAQPYPSTASLPFTMPYWKYEGYFVPPCRRVWWCFLYCLQ